MTDNKGTFKDPKTFSKREIWEDDKKWLAKIVEADKKKIGIKGKGKFDHKRFYKEF